MVQPYNTSVRIHGKSESKGVCMYMCKYKKINKYINK